MVGAKGFEPSTLWSQTRCATRLRYAPTGLYSNLPMRANSSSHLPSLAPGQDFPAVERAWGPESAAPGLLAAGGRLDVETLCRAYSNTIFPWFSEGQPILWWSPDPRMTLDVNNFKLHRSLRQVLQKFNASPGCEIRFDTVFDRVIHACASSLRNGQPGTWIVPDMVQAYIKLHRAGFAHSVETWIDGELAGGLYCVALGKAVFGESMFTRVPNASKIALAGLVGFCRGNGIAMIDCQQNTRHLASLGASEITRAGFLARTRMAILEPEPRWVFDALYLKNLLYLKNPTT
jgi:leucyl/phenylalanyl-tRNA---protein transferase